MQSILSALRQPRTLLNWPFAGAVVALLLVVTAIAQPWQHAASGRIHTTSSSVAAGAVSSLVSPVASTTPVGPGASAPAEVPATSGPAPVDKPAVAPDVVNTSSSPTVTGHAPKLPWPHTGQAGISLVGAGVLGVSGKQVPMPTASMAKAMTAYIVLRDHPLKGGESGPTIHVTRAEANAVGLDIRQDQQVLMVRSGEAITEKQAMQALMLKSANNVARILARWDAGSIGAFLTKMNATAKQLGMSSTHYTDPSGWDAKTLSTTTDQMRLAGAAMERSDFARLVSTRSAIVPIEGRIKNVNQLLGQDGIVGIKTGSMSAAGGCLMFAAKHTVHGQTVIIVGTVMGQRNSYIGDLHQAFVSTKSLVEAMQRVVGSHRVIKAGSVVGTLPGTHRQIVATKDVNVLGWAGMTYHQTIKASAATTAKSGAKVGTVSVTGAVTTSVPVAIK